MPTRSSRDDKNEAKVDRAKGRMKEAGGARARTPIRAIRTAHGSYGADKDRGRGGERSLRRKLKAR